MTSVAYKALQAGDIEKAKLAKTLAETFKIKQEGERKAHGLDVLDDKKGENGKVTVVIERKEV